MPDILYSGDRGSGKTTALVLRYCALLEKGVPPSQIQVLSGHRYTHRENFRNLLFSHHQKPFIGLRVDTHPHLASNILKTFLHLTDCTKATLLTANDTLILLQAYYESHAEQFFPGYNPTPQFFQHLLRRHQRCAQHLLWDDILKERTATLETEVIATQANVFLESFSNDLKKLTPALLDSRSQARYLHNLVQRDEVKEAYAASHWLIDDIEETHPLDQFVFDQLSENSELRVASTNPYGGLNKSMGADPAYAKRFGLPPCKTHFLEETRPLNALARKMYTCIQQLPFLENEDTAPLYTVKQSQHTGKMYEDMTNQIQECLKKEVPAHKIVCATWYLDPLATRQLQTHFEAQGIPVDILHGQQMLQRSPLVNTLLSLLRLVFWPYFTPLKNIPRLSGLDMAQIFRLCGGLNAFEVSELRFNFGNKLDAWGSYLQESTVPRLQALQASIKTLREKHSEPTLADFYEALQWLWAEQLQPYLTVELSQENTLEETAFEHVQQFLKRMVRQVELQDSLSEAHTQKLWEQIFNQQVKVHRSLPEHDNGKVKIMTAYRLCELGQTYDYQFWFDLSNPSWFRPMNHPIDNVLLLSQSWPIDKPWTLIAEEEEIEERLAKSWRKGLLYCNQEAYFYACLYNTQAQMQHSEQIIYWLENN